MNQNCERKMIILRNTANPIIEEAYLVIKDDCTSNIPESCDIIEEANRFIGSRCYTLTEHKRDRRWLYFIYGFLAALLPLITIYLVFLC